jgi:hypothetical protein
MMRFPVCLLFALMLAAQFTVPARAKATAVSTDTIFVTADRPGAGPMAAPKKHTEGLEPHRAILSNDVLEVVALKVEAVELGHEIRM